MEWPLGWMWASTLSALASVIAPWLLPRRHRQPSLLVLAAALVVFAVYESIVRTRDPQVGALIRVDLLWLLPLLAAGTLSSVGAVLNRNRA